MAQFFQVAGKPIGLIKAADVLASVPNGAAVVAFDEATNAALIADFNQNHLAYAIVGGVLQKNGVNVVIQADGQTKQDRDSLLAGAANAVQNNNTFIALSSPTAAQIAAQVKALSQQNNQLIKRLVQLTQ